jgi:histone H3/H4|tara:strand:- start:1935 stop:2765 length:831 start_codon:yes stop_codon:yes gene_type:complete
LIANNQVHPTQGNPMSAKPYSPGHIGAVAGNYTQMRISGAVKQQLVDLLCEELDRLVPQMESETLAQDPERKTLDDPNRTRLNYNRTRELMIARISNIESVGSAAVQAGIEHIEQHLAKILKHAEAAADKDRVGTIKPRHLEIAISGMGLDNDGELPEQQLEEETETLVVGQGGGVLTRSSLLSLARTHAKMPVTDDAVEELMDTYYMVVEKLEGDIRAHAQLGGNPVQFIESIGRMQTLMSLGWMRSMLTRAASNARERGYKRIDIEQIVHLDPY